jgi:hypothetical protein
MAAPCITTGQQQHAQVVMAVGVTCCHPSSVGRFGSVRIAMVIPQQVAERQMDRPFPLVDADLQHLASSSDSTCPAQQVSQVHPSDLIRVSTRP